MMKKIFIILLMTIFSLGYAQNIGDYQSVGSGNWNSTATWQVYNGTAWVNPTAGQYPGNTGGNYAVTISSATTVTVNSALDITTGNVTIKGTLTLNANLTLSGQDPFTFTIDHGVLFFAKKQNCIFPKMLGLLLISIKMLVQNRECILLIT